MLAAEVYIGPIYRENRFMIQQVHILKGMFLTAIKVYFGRNELL